MYTLSESICIHSNKIVLPVRFGLVSSRSFIQAQAAFIYSRITFYSPAYSLLRLYSLCLNTVPFILRQTDYPATGILLILDNSN